MESMEAVEISSAELKIRLHDYVFARV